MDPWQLGRLLLGQIRRSYCACKIILQGVESLATASTCEEAASRGTIPAAVLIISSLSSKDPNTSITFGGFLIILVQNVLLPGSHFIVPESLFKTYLIKNPLIRGIAEVQVERKRRKKRFCL